MNDTRLKPCPFCGGEARAFNVGGWYVRCINPNCGGFNSGSWSTEKMAIDRWNTRRPMERIVEQLEKLTKVNFYGIDLVDIVGAIEIVKAGGVDDE